MRSPFVGRRQELGVAQFFLREVALGHTGLMVIEGEAGGGKTRLLDQVLADQEPDRFTVFAAEGDPNDPRALRCLADALGCRVTSADPTKARIAELLRASPSDRGDGTTSAVQELVLDVIERVALQQPVLLVLDDLHWLDEVSLAALGSITRRLRGFSVGVLAATRPSPRVRAALDPFEPVVVRLGPLSDAELSELTTAVAGQPLALDDLGALDAVRSNPFLVSLLASTSREGAPGRSHLDVVRRMTSTLDPTLRSFLELAALAGREVDVDLLAGASGQRVTSMVSLARTAVQRGWMATDGEVVRFRHDLLSESLLSAMPAEQRDRQHLRLGRTLAELGHAPARAAFHLDSARYLLVASDVASMQRVIDGLPAGDDVATSLARRAHELDPSNAAIVCALMRGLAARHRHADAVKLARSWSERAGVDASLAGRVRLLAATSLVNAESSDAAVAILQEGLALDGVPDDLRADYLTTLARLHWYRRDAAAVRLAAVEAIEVSRSIGYVDGEISARCSLSESASLMGDLDLALTEAQEAVRLAQRQRSLASPLPELALGTALVSSGRFAEGMPVLTRSLHAAERAGDPVTMVLAQIVMQGSRFHTGDWDGFVADADAMVEIGNDTGIRNGIVFPLGFAAAVAVRRGQFDAVAPIVARLRAEATRGDGHPAAVIGLLIGDLAETEAAGRTADAAAAALSLSRALEPVGYTAQVLVAVDAARLAWEIGDRDALQTIAALTADGAARGATSTRHAIAAWCAALVGGDVDELITAATTLAATERTWDGAVALHLAGLAARREGRATAKALLTGAADRYRRLGAPRHAAAAAANEGFGALHAIASRPATTSADDTLSLLSPAEKRVLALVVDGKANGDIADALFVSKRTVESHVASLYKKLGVATRVALARAGAAAGMSGAST